MKEGIKNILFAITHSVGALKTKSTQIAVAIEHQVPPRGSTFEKFPELSLVEAAQVIKNAEDGGKLEID